MEKKSALVGIVIVVGLVALVAVNGISFFGFSKNKRSFDVSGIHFASFRKDLCAVAVIGDGPAGCAAALYAARLGFPTVVFSGETPGGQLTTTGIVENFPAVLDVTGPELMDRMHDQAKRFGAVFVEKRVAALETSSWPYVIHFEDGTRMYAFTVVVASGAKSRILGCPGEQEYWGKGVTTCAICDAALYPGKEVVVVGGGDAACEEALQLVPYASKIFMLIRSGKMRASKIMRERVEREPKIQILYDTQVLEIMGDGRAVTGVLLQKDNESSTLPISGVFLAIGHIPNTDFVKGIVEMDGQGMIKCQVNSQKTSIPGIFAAGDVENRYRQAGIAAGRGIWAALEADDFLRGAGLVDGVIAQYASSFYGKAAPSVGVSDNGVPVEVMLKKVPLEEGIEEEVRAAPVDDRKIHEIFDLKEFKAIVDRGSSVLFDLYTDTCPQCKRLKAVLDRYIENTPKEKRIAIYSINLGRVAGALESFGVSHVPVLLAYSRGKEIDREEGYMSEKALRKWIEKIYRQ